MYQSLYFCFVSLKTHKFTATWGQIVSSAHKIAFWSAPCINVWPWYAVWILFLSRVTTGFLTDRRTWAQESASQRHKDVSSLCGVSFVFFLQHWLSYSCVLSAVFYLLHAFMMSSSLVFMRKTFAFVSKKKKLTNMTRRSINMEQRTPKCFNGDAALSPRPSYKRAPNQTKLSVWNNLFF